jgi:soluble lytic murein transglycosylase-like protein
MSQECCRNANFTCGEALYTCTETFARRSVVAGRAVVSHLTMGALLTRHRLTSACAAALAALAAAHADAGTRDYDAMVMTHARANHVPAALVHRVIRRESKYHPELVGHGGTIGLMQIKLETAKGLGYRGDVSGLHDPNTNLAYGVKYLAGAYRAAEGDLARAMHFYAAGYYEAAKRLRLELAAGKRLEANGNPQPPLSGDAARKRPAKDTIKDTTFARAQVSRPLSIVPPGAKAAQAR